MNMKITGLENDKNQDANHHLSGGMKSLSIITGYGPFSCLNTFSFSVSQTRELTGRDDRQ